MLKRLYLKLLINIYEWSCEIKAFSEEAIAKVLHVDISDSDSLVKGINKLRKIKHRNLLEIKWAIVAKRVKFREPA